MKYSISIDNYAIKQIKKLDKSAIPIIKNAIETLADNPRPTGYKKLKNAEAYRIRVGNYRIIYEINDDKLIVIVVSAGHRKNVYI